MIVSKCDPTENLKWKFDSGIYSLQLADGKAIITEQDIDNAERYVPTILGQNEQVLCDFKHPLSFENAEAYIRANLIEIDRQDNDDSQFTEKVTHALDNCIEVLSGDTRQYQRMRLQNIKRFLKHEPIVHHHTSDHDWSTYTFDWTYADNLYRAKTPHGIAIIEEKATTNESRFLVGSATEYNLQLEDETGVLLESYFVTPIDFTEAEHRMREFLAHCENTSVAEETLDQITFSLEICKCLLPSDTDFMVFVRLRYLDYYLSERLL